MPGCTASDAGNGARTLSRDLSKRSGSGFSVRTLVQIRGPAPVGQFRRHCESRHARRHRRTFIRDFRPDSPSPLVTPDAMHVLLQNSWPAIVGELKRVIGRALILCDGPEISPNHLTVEIQTTFRRVANAQASMDAREGGPENAASNPESDREPVPPRDPESKCSMCGQLEREVRKLISGPRVFIPG